MFQLIGLVVSIGLADALNPATVAPGLYLASGEHPSMTVADYHEADEVLRRHAKAAADDELGVPSEVLRERYLSALAELLLELLLPHAAMASAAANDTATAPRRVVRTWVLLRFQFDSWESLGVGLPDGVIEL